MKKTYYLFPHKMDIKWVLNNQTCVKQTMLCICITQRAGHEMGADIMNLSNSFLIMGFMVSFDTQYWVKYWFLEPNNVSVTKVLIVYFQTNLVLSGF